MAEEFEFEKKKTLLEHQDVIETYAAAAVASTNFQ
jgi:hypothetical protein